MELLHSNGFELDVKDKANLRGGEGKESMEREEAGSDICTGQNPGSRSPVCHF